MDASCHQICDSWSYGAKVTLGYRKVRRSGLLTFKLCRSRRVAAGSTRYWLGVLNMAIIFSPHACHLQSLNTRSERGPSLGPRCHTTSEHPFLACIKKSNTLHYTLISSSKGHTNLSSRCIHPLMDGELGIRPFRPHS